MVEAEVVEEAKEVDTVEAVVEAVVIEWRR